MLKTLRHSYLRSSVRGLMAPVVLTGFVLAMVVLMPGLPLAQQKPVHLNPIIAKLAEGKTVYGISTSDLSVENARVIARAPADFVYVDMEHSPLDFPGLRLFLIGMTDRAMVLKKGNLQPNVALLARFPPEADQSQWVVKQALDIGLHGVLFNGGSGASVGMSMSGMPTCGRSIPKGTCWRC